MSKLRMLTMDSTAADIQMMGNAYEAYLYKYDAHAAATTTLAAALKDVCLTNSLNLECASFSRLALLWCPMFRPEPVVAAPPLLAPKFRLEPFALGDDK